MEYVSVRKAVSWGFWNNFSRLSKRRDDSLSDQRIVSFVLAELR